jgi:hypothetical protein
MPKFAWIGLGVLVACGVLFLSVWLYGDTKFKLGVAQERAAWTQKYAEAVAARVAAQAALATAQHDRDLAIQQRDQARSAEVAHVQT